MSSLIMPDKLAIHFQNVSKIYKLYGSQRDQLIEVLRLSRFGFKVKSIPKEFIALNDISIEVPRGHRIGIVGRNGAGKTTLLKLICGNFAPTCGQVDIAGRIQALMGTGLGFHPEYTGRDNVESSLQYNGLRKNEYTSAMESIIDFCELGDFLDQPFKTYSLGMQARLMFAAATAISPDILIVDEVLGAGDAYFVAKSKKRVEKLVSNGCTMLLVSHSMSQVLELCEEAIWLDQGRIRMQGDAFSVVKAYEQFLHGSIGDISASTKSLHDDFVLLTTESSSTEQAVLGRSFGESPQGVRNTKRKFQEPFFVPHANKVLFHTVKVPLGFDFIASGGVSRWEGGNELQITGFTIVDEQRRTNVLCSLQPVKFVFEITSQNGGEFSCRYSLNISNHMGQTVSSTRSPEDVFVLQADELRIVEVIFNPLQLGIGQYTVGFVILDYGTLELINSAHRYDLLSRSFEFSVENPDSWSTLQSQFFHSSEWSFT